MLVISLAQSDRSVDWSRALLDAAAARPWMTSVDVKALSTHATQLGDLVQRLRHMKLDVTEYTCLKAIVLFRPGKKHHLCDVVNSYTAIRPVLCDGGLSSCIQCKPPALVGRNGRKCGEYTLTGNAQQITIQRVSIRSEKKMKKGK